MRVAILWTHLSGYINACFKALKEIKDVDLFVANIRASDDAPFSDSQFNWIDRRFQWVAEPDAADLIRLLHEFRPDVILCANWHNTVYRQALTQFKYCTIRILTSDRPWRGTARQWLGVLAAKAYIHPLCDGIFVAGERQITFAKRMGFRLPQIITGLLSCDHSPFSALFPMRDAISSESFAYVGRLSPEKGIDVLVKAYQRYRGLSPNPWSLMIYGAGPLEYLVKGLEGINHDGFVQPDDLPAKLLESSCLIMPSHLESWGIAVHEATASGMAVIVSDGVGASVHLVQEGYNGYIFETGNAEDLSRSMFHYSIKTLEERREMSANSYRMSFQFTPKRWAHSLVDGVTRLKDEVMTGESG